MVVVTNLKPGGLGDLEAKQDRRPRTLQYFRITVASGSQDHVRLRTMEDVRVTFMTTQVQQHLPQPYAFGDDYPLGGSLTVLSGASNQHP
jgi:hypothetical protein